MKRYTSAVAIYCALVLSGLGCATSLDSATEAAIFALDSGDYTTAITKATEALAANANDLDATILLSSGYAGRAGVNYLDLTKEISTEGEEDNVFQQIHTAFVATISSTGLADLRLAVTTLEDFAGTFTTTREEEDFRFQLGMLQTIEALALPGIVAQPTAGGTLTVTDITEAQRVTTRDDFIAADNNLILGGLAADNALVNTVRVNYCALKDLSANDSFSVEELQDVINCQLNSAAASLVAADFQSAAVTLCTDISFSCTAIDTAL